MKIIRNPRLAALFTGIALIVGGCATTPSQPVTPVGRWHALASVTVLELRADGTATLDNQGALIKGTYSQTADGPLKMDFGSDNGQPLVFYGTISGHRLAFVNLRGKKVSFRKDD